jgi:hypothetical protein
MVLNLPLHSVFPAAYPFHPSLIFESKDMWPTRVEPPMKLYPKGWLQVGHKHQTKLEVARSDKHSSLLRIEKSKLLS